MLRLAANKGCEQTTVPLMKHVLLLDTDSYASPAHVSYADVIKGRHASAMRAVKS
jgi:hypothetical protein